ncbi:hypothetical protein [Borrelia sp. RT1S]|uniref:hypothetical protein n=1 Tax=Borrelia sp. RT1S TaxID=2898580 RepID=UPI001E4371D2|nr:hypothetical protein [Borrelia sp. RT1S]UGQ17932.1 hypothetical protein LSO05_05730 [Borrelia sp. RT1S]
MNALGFIGAVLFVVYVYVSGACILRIIEAIFSGKKRDSVSRVVYRSRSMSRGRDNRVAPDSAEDVYVKNLGSEKRQEQQDILKQRQAVRLRAQEQQDIIKQRQAARAQKKLDDWQQKQRFILSQKQGILRKNKTYL